MYENKHTGSNIKVTNFTKEVIRKAALMMEMSEIKLIAELVENEYPQIVNRVRSNR